MNTYKIVIESNLSKVSLKNYSVQYSDVLAKNETEAVSKMQAQHGENFSVALVSII